MSKGIRLPDYEKPKIPKAKNAEGGIAKKGMKAAQAGGSASSGGFKTKKSKLPF